jgi:hypothetical protein
MFQLVEDIHLYDIGSLYWQKPQRHDRCAILKISVNRVSTVLGLAYSGIKASGGLSRV